MSIAENTYRSHDYKFLIQRWRKICQSSGLRMQKICESDNYPCFEISSSVLQNHDVIYLSAGIHGDEPASSLGLLKWAESNLSQLSSFPFLIYPCLNPWGLENNSRWDANRTDLNRIWKDPQNILIAYIISRTNNLTFKLVLNLHEDFDGQGVYLYEPSRGGKPSGVAANILRASSSIIACDPRTMIDGRKARNGIIRPRPTNPPKDGFPEALHFCVMHRCLTITLETPSEFDFLLRINAQSAMIEKAVSIFLQG